MSASDWIHLDVEKVVAATDSAFLVRLEDGEEIWLPKSQIESPSEYDTGDQNCTISITKWIAEKRGIG